MSESSDDNKEVEFDLSRVWLALKAAEDVLRGGNEPPLSLIHMSGLAIVYLLRISPFATRRDVTRVLNAAIDAMVSEEYSDTVQGLFDSHIVEIIN